MARECECPEEHSITKLGHCRTCSFHGVGGHAMCLDVVGTPVIQQFDEVTVFSCGADGHTDGTPHDFSWATYSDETMSYGVCRCGYDDYTHSMLTLP